MRSSELGCDHDGTATAVVLASSQKVQRVSAPSAIDVVEVEFSSPRHVLATAATYGTHSPPGARTPSLSLRI
jgi:hypothetical protein